MKQNRLAMRVLLILVAGTAWAGQQQWLYSVASEKSKIEVHVYKDGLFKAFGHDHLITARQISGQVRFEAQKAEASSVRLKVDAKSLTVVDPGESEKDRQEVQATMMSEKVLDAAKFPEIEFTSKSVSSVKKTPAGWDVTLSGVLKLHGVERQVSLPIHASAEGNHLKAQGEVSLLQTEYGITPIRVGGGAVKVKDKIKIAFLIMATSNNP